MDGWQPIAHGPPANPCGATRPVILPYTGGSDWRQLKRPRIGLYRSWMSDMDEGWTRWLLEQFGFAYTTLRNNDVQAAGLRDRFDTIVFADEQPGAIQNGHAAGTMPPEFTGGLGEKGAAALRDFVSAGGTLVFLNRATGYAIGHLGVKAKDVLAGVPSRDFYCPGSLLNARLDTRQPAHSRSSAGSNDLVRIKPCLGTGRGFGCHLS